MKLYHGSKLKVDKPSYNGSKKDNDYGPAFYMTRDLESAHEWACKNGTAGIVNAFEFNDENLNILDLTNKNNYSVLHWLAILLHFRTLEASFIKSFKTRLDFIENHYYIDISKYDLIIGYRADDAYFRFPADFIRGNITLEQLEYAFNLGSLGIQYVIISPKGISHLKYIKSFTSENKYINRYYDNVTFTTKRYDDLNKDEDGTRIFDIMKDEK